MSTPSDGIYLNYAITGNVLEELQWADQQLSQMITNLEQSVQPLRASWLGASDQEYQKIQAKWTLHMNAMTALLSAHHGTLSEMAINVNTNDLNIASQWEAIP